MKKILLASAILSLSQIAIADRTAIGDDGREIRLKENGSWEYIFNSAEPEWQKCPSVAELDDGNCSWKDSSQLRAYQSAELKWQQTKEDAEIKN